MTETMLVLQNITLVALTIVVTLNTVTIAKALNTPLPRWFRELLERLGFSDE